MVPLTAQAHQWLSEYITAGDVVIDATAGNGHDTCFLAERVGPEGHVIAIDLQPQACEACRLKVAERGHRHVAIHCGNHADLEAVLPRRWHGQVAAVMFNLGYLPGGDKSVVTTGASTLLALSAAMRVMREGGVLSLLVYRGHAGGTDEAAEVEGWIGDALQKGAVILYQSPAHSPISPVLFVLQKRNTTS